MKRSSRSQSKSLLTKRIKLELVKVTEEDLGRAPLLQLATSNITTKQEQAQKVESLQSPHKLNDTKEFSEDESDSEVYEKRRQQNVEDNANFLASLGMMEAKQKVNQAFTRKVKTKPSMNGLGREKREPGPPLPRRQSLRIRRMDPSGNDLPEPPAPLFQPEEEHPRIASGPLDMVTSITNSVEESHTKALIASIHKLPLSSQVKDNNTKPLEKYVADLSHLRMNESRVTKLVPQRIFSLAVHPGAERILACAGDKWGRVGVWDVESSAGQGGVYCFEPHSRPVNFLQFNRHNPNHLHSCSYDGTLRRADFNKGVFEEVYITPEDDDVRLNCFDFLYASSLVVSQSDGCVAVVDTRASVTAQNIYMTHARSVRSVQVHPTDTNTIVTASPDATVCLWDMRKMCKKKSSSLALMQHGRSVDSAYFSPLTGRYILTTSMDDCIKVYDATDLNHVHLTSSVRHNNHTGRWLTNFKASWHPCREDMFVVGSMERPRRIEVFNAKCKLLMTLKDSDHLNSVCSINVFHPTRNIIVGGNSSGRVHVFM